jgi:hypothetical protein
VAGVIVLALAVEVHLADAQSLKQKRGVVRSLVDGARARFGVAAAEVGFQDQWQRARLGFAAVSGSSQHAVEVIDSVDRFVWSHPEIHVVESERTWLEVER